MAKKKVGLFRVLLHTLFGFLTGGIWFIVLLVRWLLNNSR
jgi:hypothetical protein